MKQSNRYTTVKPSQTSSVMMFLFWGMLIIMLTYIFNQMLSHRRNPNQQVHTLSENGIKMVTLQRNPRGHYIATGKINQTSVTLLVDTGATTVALPTSLAEQLGLERGPQITASTANGEVTGYFTKLDSVQVGEIRVNNVRAMILPNMGNEVLLGMSFLRGLDFSQSGTQLTLRQK